MSRCVSFPPPEYMKNDLQGVALLKHLELLREKILSKKKNKIGKRKRKQGYSGDEVRKKKCKDGKEENEKNTRNNRNSIIENSTLPMKLGQPTSVNDYSDKGKLGGKEKSSTFPSQAMVMKASHKRNSEYNHSQGGCLIGKSEFDPNENLEFTVSLLLVFPPLHTIQIDFEDEKWWLSKKNISKSETTRAKYDSIDTSINQGIQLYARYLPDADVYALPYVVPF